MIAERRSAQRYRTYCPVRLHPSSVIPVVETLTKDLSSGGLCCLSSTLFPVSTELQVELVVAVGSEPLSARGRAVWFRTIPQSDQFTLGIAFQDLSPHDKRRLSVYLDRLSSQSATISV